MTPSLCNTTATSHLSSLPTAISLPGLTVRFLAGWGRVVQGSTLSVQGASLLPPSPSRLDSGPPATVPRLTPFFMPLNGVSFTPRYVLFESITVFSNSLSVLSTLSALLPYLTPKSLSDTQSVLNVLSESKVVHFEWIPDHYFLPGHDLADSLAKVGASPRSQCPSHPLFPHTDCPSTSVGDAVSNLVSFIIKSLQCLLRSLLSLAPLAVLSLVYAVTGTALYLGLISTGLVEPRLLHAATLVLNHRTFLISC